MRRAAVCLLVVALGLCIAGCGDDGTADAQPDGAEATTTESTAAPEAPASENISSSAPTPSSATSPSETQPLVEMRVPASVGPWDRLRTGAAQQLEHRAIEDIAGEAVTTAAAVSGVYSRSANDGLVFLGITEPSADPAKAVYNGLAVVGVEGYSRYTFGGSGSDLGCGPTQPAHTGFACQYADADRVIYLIWDNEATSGADAARLTVQFRDAALQR
jgi:hypothetical protein